MRSLRAGALAALVSLGLGHVVSCARQETACTVDAYVNDAIGDDTEVDCGTFQADDPALTAKTMAAAQSCVVNTAQARQSFRFEYDRINVTDNARTGERTRDASRVAFIGTTDTGVLVLRWYVHPFHPDGTTGPLVLHTCEGVIGADTCKTTVPALPGKPDNDRPPWAQGDTDACLQCVNPGPAQTLCP